MSFEDVMATVGRWMVATDALAALGAELELSGTVDTGDPRTVAALQAVSAAAGLGPLDDLAPPQRALVLGLIRMTLRHAGELIDDPGRAPGWTYREPDILQGWGRGSTVVAAELAGLPELAGVRSFLDVGTGVGLLAMAAAQAWPEATVTGIDVWRPSLDAAVELVRSAGLAERISLREQDVTELDDVETYDCAWFPTFFVRQEVLDAAIARLVQALRPGGWLVLGRMAPPPDPLAEATSVLRVVRGGGEAFDAKHLSDTLVEAGCTDIRTVPHRGPAPLEYVFGRRPE